MVVAAVAGEGGVALGERGCRGLVAEDGLLCDVGDVAVEDAAAELRGLAVPQAVGRARAKRMGSAAGSTERISPRSSHQVAFCLAERTTAPRVGRPMSAALTVAPLRAVQEFAA